MKKIGITGGIGAGKSLICKIFELLGIPNYPADYRAKWLQENDPHLTEQIKNNFGQNSYTSDGKLNRTYLSEQVFSDDSKLKQLNSLVHPAVAIDFEEWCRQHENKPYILKEAALLFETGSFKQLDATINVHASQELRLKRTLSRDSHRKESDVIAIMRKQLRDGERLKLADYIIYNDESRSIIKQVIALNQQIQSS
ncbi:dephospho-CoA kinase [Marivirga lumbricoides]|uniref:Dephospho-CoA kinase n=1 Tax=Marivirga lumbricoides TaxID=1046115 RepID=A0ABQ1MK56_9BACT|nr:dephospho-CoA kinase [Marivirga lumbricoides]